MLPRQLALFVDVIQNVSIHEGHNVLLDIWHYFQVKRNFHSLNSKYKTVVLFFYSSSKEEFFKSSFSR